ncbi:hypothetical protein B0H63DRAFT_456048 [Podospora didyma]|uniref:Uncharacterized protein n=1 Tax=Podospora didyma TaxID=330526 RepID=A0AAE0K1Y8_9PEZI|nr:hypothetical protein B0H63DRAFT_456048 [Podospora didyma]
MGDKTMNIISTTGKNSLNFPTRLVIGDGKQQQQQSRNQPQFFGGQWVSPPESSLSYPNGAPAPPTLQQQSYLQQNREPDFRKIIEFFAPITSLARFMHTYAWAHSYMESRAPNERGASNRGWTKKTINLPDHDLVKYDFFEEICQQFCAFAELQSVVEKSCASKATHTAAAKGAWVTYVQSLLKVRELIRVSKGITSVIK